MQPRFLVTIAIATLLGISAPAGSAEETKTFTKQQIAAYQQKKQQASALNNDGVTLMSKGELHAAIAKFLAALQLCHGYNYAKENLAIAYNNYALKSGSKAALVFFTKSLEIQPDNTTAAYNLKELLKSLGHTPGKPLPTGTVEPLDKPLVALDPAWLKLDPEAVFIQGQEQKYANNFKPYMVNLQKQLKKGWFPPKGEESKRVVVIFTIGRNGHLSNLKLDQSSGMPAADKAALKAITDTAPFSNLPEGSPETVDIQFTFDYNVFGGKEAKPSPHSDADRKRLVSNVAGAKKAMSEKKYDEAMALLQKASAIEADETASKLESQCIVEKISAAKDTSESTIKLLYHAASLDPSNEKATTLIDNVLKKQGKDPASFEERAKLARQLKDKKEFEPALYEYGRALKLKSDQTIANERNSVYTLRIGKELVDRWTLAVSRNASADALTGLGKAYEMSGEDDQAEAKYKMALNKDPNFDLAKQLLAALKAKHQPEIPASAEK